MSNAFEITPDDILNVVHRMGKKITGEKCNDLLESLDQFKIENEALRANDLETQTDYAYQEIERQIKEGNLL